MSLKKAIIVLSVVPLLLLAVSQCAEAQAKQLTIPDTTAKKGDTLLVPIRISSLSTSDSLYAGQLTLSYNSGVMTVYGIQTAGTLTAGSVNTYFNATTRQFSFASGTIITGSGVLVYLKVGTLLYPSVMSDSLRIAGAMLNEGTPAVNIDNGYFRFLSITVSPKTPSGSFAVGDSLQFTVSGDQQLPLTWSTSNASVGTITSAGLLKGVGVGQLKVFVTDARGLKDSTNLFAVNSAQLTSLNLRVRDTSYTQTLFFNLPVYISDVSALGVYSGQFSLSFNSAILQASDVITAGSLTSGWSAPAFNISGGRIDVALAGGTPLSGGGILAFVRFRVLPTASGSTPLTLSSVLFNENINASLTNGTFYTIGAPTVVVSPSTATLTRGDTLRFNVISGGTPPYAWTSTNTSVATINSSNGLLTAVARGTTTVKVVDALGFNATTGNINVNDLRVIFPDTVVAASDSVDVPIQVEDLTGLGLYSYDFRLVYDSTVVRFAQLLSTGTMSSAMNFAVRDTVDTLRVGAAGAIALTSAGQLLKLRFKAAPGVSNGQTSTITFPFFRFNEIGGSTPTATTVNGRLTIGTLANLVPVQPTLLAPVSGMTGVAVNPTFSWNVASRAATYNLQVSTASDFSTLMVNQSGIATTSYAASGLANNAVYYWRVSATNANGSSAYSTVFSFTTVVAPPSAPTLVSPADSATGIATNPVLNWNASAGATTYTVQISTSSSFSSFVANQSGVAGTTYNAGGLSNSTQYFWRVSASNAGGGSAFSTARSFITAPVPPAAPSLVSPADSATGVSVSPTLSWNASATATSYTIQIATTSSFSSFVVNQSGVTNTTYGASGLSNSTQYFWRISATNAGGTSGFSATRLFTTTALGPPIPVLATPANADTGIAVSPTLSWNPSAGATSYTLQVSPVSNFSTILFSQSGITATSAAVGPLGTSTVYYWRVSATNGSGTSAYSAASSFTTVLQPPAIPALASPANGSTNLSLNQTVVWRPSLGATSYSLQIAFDSLFTSLLIYLPSYADTQYVPVGLVNSGKYYWRVRASNAGGISAYSSAFSFTTIIAAPPTGNIVSPVNGTTGLSLSPTLVWHALARAATYNVQVSTDFAFGSFAINQTGIVDTSYVASGLLANTNYYWRVSGTNSGGTGFWSSGYNFVTGSGVPSAPSLSSPANGATGVAASPTLSWSASTGATSYTLQVSTAADFSALVVNQGGITSTSSSIGPLSSNALYYWRVSAANAAGTSAYSTAFSFTTIVAAPTAPTLSSPTSAATGVAVSPTLSWNVSTGATSYTLQVSTAADFSALVVNQSGITSTSSSVGPLSNNTVYYWRVNATNAGGTSAYSTAFSFTTVVATPTAPVLSSPANAATGVALSPTLSWNASTGATSYTLQVSTAPDFSALVLNQSGIVATSSSVGPLSNNTVYYWRVSAANAGGTSAFSASSTFTTIVAAPAAPTLLSPANGATGVSLNPILSWSPSTGATSYTVQLSTSSDFSTLTLNQSGITTTSYSTPPLTSGMVYYWRVSATGVGGSSPFSAVFSLTVSQPGPALSTPHNGDTNVPISTLLVWAHDPSVTKYTLQISTSSSFDAGATQTIDNISFSIVGAGGYVSANVGPLQNNTLYYWRVRLTNRFGTSEYSLPFHFTTATNVVTLYDPSNRALDVSLTPRLQWFHSTIATSYTLQLSTSPSFIPDSTQTVSNIPFTVSGAYASTSSPVGPLRNNTTYYWRVSSTNPGGTTAYSAAFQFTTAPLPGAPALQLPLNLAINVATSATLSWNSVGAATSYHLQVSTASTFTTLLVNLANVTATSSAVSLALNTTYFWRVSAVNSIGEGPFSEVRSFSTVRTTDVERLSGEVPVQYFLSQNYPNPFNPSTRVTFSLPSRSSVRLSVYSIAGTEIAVLFQGVRSAGEYAARFDAAAFPSGTYVLRMTATPLDGNDHTPFVAIRKMILLK
jgi:transposase-like protein